MKKLIVFNLALATLGTALLFAEDLHKPRNTTANVDIWDYCDPTSFNAALGPNACTRDIAPGSITLAGFSTELGLDKSVGAWRFTPEILQSEGPAMLNLKNQGGETHTFTKVKAFGGGFVAPLNTASGNPTPAPECAQMANGALAPQAPGPGNLFLAPGATGSVQVSRPGDLTRYQCCIHPWMRMVVSHDDHEHHH